MRGGKDRVHAGKSLTRREAKERTRRRLLDAARTLILAGGEARISASSVAREAGVAAATFYEHFSKSDDLLRALAEQLFDDLRTELAGQRRHALASPNHD